MNDQAERKTRRSTARTETDNYTPVSNPPQHPGAGRPRVSNSTEVYQQMSDLRGEDREHFVTFDLDARHRVIARRTVSIGSLTGVEVHYPGLRVIRTM